MNQYLVTARDFTDENAIDRRLAARPSHFDNARRLKASGNFISGGAILDGTGKMIGSMMVFQFETEEGLQAWKDSEPYISQRVWEKITIEPFKLADV